MEMGAKDEEFRGLGLTSRRNLCLHPEVRRPLEETQMKEADGERYRSARKKRARPSTRDVVISLRLLLVRREGPIRGAYRYVVITR